MLIAGIDEAGRGPVIGPMVIAIAAIDDSEMFQLHTLGVKDSKQLQPYKRRELYKKLIKLTKHKIIIIPNTEIDAAVQDNVLNLNWLEAEKSAELINFIKPKLAILDCPSTNLKDYKNYIQKKIKIETELKVEHKADVNHVIVSAASILAKVTRDREIEKLKKLHKVDFGSGYPSDPATVKFLEENYSKYDFFRKSWESYQRVARAKGQKKLGEF